MSFTGLCRNCRTYGAEQMDVLNQILVQLAEADRLACAANPHCRRLAVVLLDNIVEVQLRRKTEMEFLFDRTTWYSGPRKHDYRTRRAIMRVHPKLVAFAQRQEWLDSGEAQVLSYAHRIRNETYHEGGFNALDGEIAIRMLYSFPTCIPSQVHAEGTCPEIQTAGGSHAGNG